MRTTPSTPPPPREHSELSVGSMVAGYVVEALIGVGSMAHVYRARSPRTGQRVAVKLLARSVGARQDQVERLRREAEVLQLIDHAHVVRVLDFGATADGCPFLVMELVVGRTLSALVEAEAPVGARRVRALLSQIAAGLAATHEAGLVHRDLKPSNVLVQELGPSVHVKLVDFGLVRGLDVPLGRALTHHQAVLGTPLYMAPEQIMSARQVGPAADLYALGVLGYELLSGRVPFEGPMMTVFERHLHEPPPPLTTNTGLEPLVLALLEKDPARRPVSAQVVIATLAQLGHEPATDRTLLLDPSVSRAADALEPRGPSGITELVSADAAATSDLTAAAPLPSAASPLALVFDEGTVEDAPWSQRLGRGRHAPPATRILVEDADLGGPRVLASDAGVRRAPVLALGSSWREETSWFDAGAPDFDAEADDEGEAEELPIFDTNEGRLGVDIDVVPAAAWASWATARPGASRRPESLRPVVPAPPEAHARADGEATAHDGPAGAEATFGEEPTGLDEAVGFGDEVTRRAADDAFDDDSTGLEAGSAPHRSRAFDEESTHHEGVARGLSSARWPELAVPLPEVLRAQPVFDAGALAGLRDWPELGAPPVASAAAAQRPEGRDGLTRAERSPRVPRLPPVGAAQIEVSHGASWPLRVLTAVAVLLAVAAVIVALAARAAELSEPLPAPSSGLPSVRAVAAPPVVGAGPATAPAGSRARP